MEQSHQLFKNHRFPAAIIEYAVWLYFTFPLSFLCLQFFQQILCNRTGSAVNLAFFMVNLSQVMLRPYREHDPNVSVLDLKAQF